jgi:predicted secreted protein
MTKYAAYGTLFKRGATAIVYVTNIGGPGLSLDVEDVTSHDSPGAWEESVATILRSGEVSLDIEYDPNAATHKNAAGGLIADMVARTAQTYNLVFPSVSAVTWTFSAFVIGFEPGAPHDGALTAAVKVKPTGELTLA